MMQKIKVNHLDIPIIRSCNLACLGCMTHSNHKNVKGVVRVEDSIEWLKFWAERIEIPSVTIFGGEPLLHPQFTEWVKATKEIFNVAINFNTNGYYLDTLFDKIGELFTEDMALSMVVSAQTGSEPYLSTVHNNFELLKQKIVEYHLNNGAKTAYWDLWLDEYDVNNKRWYRLILDGRSTAIGFAICDQYKLHWTTFYTGYADTMQPVYDYDDETYPANHERCQASYFVTLYKGRMYKCPPIGVLEHSLETFNIQNDPNWKKYLDNITSVGCESSDEEITAWFEQQAKPEKLCNMCGFAGPRGGSITTEDRSHYLKTDWKYIPIQAK